MNPQEFLRLANNFYNSKNIVADVPRIGIDAELVNFVNTHQDDLKKKAKVAFVFICLNPLYWQFVAEIVVGARQFFLPGHETDFFFWTDIPETKEEILQGYKNGLKTIGLQIPDDMDLMAAQLQIADRNIVLDTPNIINSIVFQTFLLDVLFSLTYHFLLYYLLANLQNIMRNF